MTLPVISSKLEARVDAVNRCHTVANQLYAGLIQLLEPFIGQKVKKADGTLLKKVKELINEVEWIKNPPQTISIFPNTSYNLVWTVSTYTPFNGIAYYHNTTICVGTLHNGFLEKLETSSEDFRTDYTVEEIQNLRAKFRDAKQLVQKIENQLYPFGEYDC